MSADRGAILARRRHFLIVALAGVGCASPPASVPTQSSSAKPTPSADQEEPDASIETAVDTDKDGILDAFDRCPAVPGTSGGCPRPCLMIIEPTEIQILEQIMFSRGKSKIQPQSFPILDAIVALLKEHPKIVTELAGHTQTGEPDALAQERSQAVRDYLVEKGIVAERLVVKSYGSTRPYTREPEGNRRVEFKITEQ